MTNLLELAPRIDETKRAIARHEAALSLNRTSSLEASLCSLQKRLAKLEAELIESDPNRSTLENCRSAPASQASAK